MAQPAWEKVKELFHTASDLPPSQREAYLTAACQGDEALRREVESLLSHDVSQAGVLERVAQQARAWTERPAPERKVPASVGRYRIVSLVGEGGMGTVYEAEQDQPHRTVALKVLKPGMTTPEVMRRFAQEPEALGRLQHPGIAQIYEAGTAETGFGTQPYFAMEFIRGLSLLEYALAHDLNPRQRLELIAKVCEAVDTRTGAGSSIAI